MSHPEFSWQMMNQGDDRAKNRMPENLGINSARVALVIPANAGLQLPRLLI